MTSETNELKHRYEFSRHIFQMLVGWFTFFAGLNIVVLGWVVTSVFTAGAIPGYRLGLLVSALFVFQNVLAILVAVAYLLYLNGTDRRIRQLVEEPDRRSAHPYQLYRRIGWLIVACCVSFLVSWSLIPAVVSWGA